ncbi:MAG: type II toxin-antitoxin system VapC family toxin [Betaproteobacteria bacterium]|jgi:predicted nucleic acid-binding protein|nr:type II toxin-antitoxin system VapC family toxin [Betaproteobacteria bacterium]
MIVLDTNVLSECWRKSPNIQVLTWLAAQPQASLFTTTVVESEILYGVQLLADGARKDALSLAVKAVFNDNLTGRVLTYDRDAARSYAEIASNRKKMGKPISQFDAMIAAVAHSRGATLATRNVKDFEGCAIQLVDPWAS